MIKRQRQTIVLLGFFLVAYSIVVMRNLIISRWSNLLMRLSELIMALCGIVDIKHITSVFTVMGQIKKIQECIPVRSVLLEAVAVTGGLHTPPRSRHPPWPDPLNFPLGCGPGPDPPQLPPWLWAWRPPWPDPP